VQTPVRGDLSIIGQVDHWQTMMIIWTFICEISLVLLNVDRLKAEEAEEEATLFEDKHTLVIVKYNTLTAKLEVTRDP
jgi:hypothetical protein